MSNTGLQSTVTVTSGTAMPLMATCERVRAVGQALDRHGGRGAGRDHVVDAVDGERGVAVVTEVLEQERHGAVEGTALLGDGDAR